MSLTTMTTWRSVGRGDVVQRLPGHAAGERAVADRRPRRAGCCRGRRTPWPARRRRTATSRRGCSRPSRARSRRGSGSRTARRLAQPLEALDPAGEHLVHVGLVPGVEDDRLARRAEHPVQGDGQLDAAEVGAEVAAGLRDAADQRVADLCGQGGELVGGSARRSRVPGAIAGAARLGGVLSVDGSCGAAAPHCNCGFPDLPIAAAVSRMQLTVAAPGRAAHSRGTQRSPRSAPATTSTPRSGGPQPGSLPFVGDHRRLDRVGGQPVGELDAHRAPALPRRLEPGCHVVPGETGQQDRVAAQDVVGPVVRRARGRRARRPRALLPVGGARRSHLLRPARRQRPVHAAQSAPDP